MGSYDIDLGFAHCQVATWCFLTTWKQTWVSKVDEPVRHLEFATHWSNGDHGATLARRRKASHIFFSLYPNGGDVNKAEVCRLTAGSSKVLQVLKEIRLPHSRLPRNVYFNLSKLDSALKN